MPGDKAVDVTVDTPNGPASVCLFLTNDELYAGREGLTPDQMPVLSFYKQTIFPQIVELHQIRHPKTA